MALSNLASLVIFNVIAQIKVTQDSINNHHDVVERLAGCLGAADSTWVIFKPVSGRTHQLRIHSRELGHPILGCDLYATDEAFFMADRLMLHATRIEFDHPVSGKRIYGFSPCPF